MNLVLLTHSRELERPSNTGKLVTALLTEHSPLQVRTVVWQRKQPCSLLLAQLASEAWALVYPGVGAICSAKVLGSDNLGSGNLGNDNPPEGLILLDATWQEAQKMYNQSPYLHELTKVLIEQKGPSVYRLRRNQKDYGLCTAECVSTLLNQLGLRDDAETLLQSLEIMQQGLGR
ncbi:DTW domain-containing protein [Shewanella denitrificans]|nr:tRNA-uridine aminocarboxypropyltransferase [Shewanella denitrificans]